MKKKMINKDQLIIDDILNSNYKMIRNFFISGIKDERVKVAKKRVEQFIIVYFIVEKKRSVFWNKQYMESYILLPDPIKQLNIVQLNEFEKIPYEEFFPNKTYFVKIDDLNIPNLIYTVYKNYIERLEIYNNINKYADIINEWDKQITDQIKGISEIEIDVKE